jgi:hypothetical protein
MKLQGWTFLYFIADYAFSVVASTPELFIFTIACFSIDARGGFCCLVLGDSYMMRCPSILFFSLEDSFLVSGVCLLDIVF